MSLFTQKMGMVCPLSPFWSFSPEPKSKTEKETKRNMTDHFEDYEIEALENVGFEVRLLPDDREALHAALICSLEIFSAPGEADPDDVLVVIETLEEFHPYFLDTQVSDKIGEAIELLHEICEETVLGFEDAQKGKRAVEAITQALRIEFFYPEIESGEVPDFDESN